MSNSSREETSISQMRIISENDHGWLWLNNPNSNQKEVYLKGTDYDYGKYLLFGKDREKLIKTGKKILRKFDLYESKVNINLREGSDSYVLVIYDLYSQKRIEKYFQKYYRKSYAGWKSNYLTIVSR